MFLFSVVCSKPLTYTLMSLWPDLFHRVYCNHSGHPAQGRTVDNINIFWQILVCNIKSLQSVLLKFFLCSAQGHVPFQLLSQCEPCMRSSLPQSLASFSKMFWYSCCNKHLYFMFMCQWLMNCDIMKAYHSRTVLSWSWLVLGHDPAGCSVQQASTEKTEEKFLLL